jgi:hypothetical protein
VIRDPGAGEMRTQILNGSAGCAKHAIPLLFRHVMLKCLGRTTRTHSMAQAPPREARTSENDDKPSFVRQKKPLLEFQQSNQETVSTHKPLIKERL